MRYRLGQVKTGFGRPVESGVRNDNVANIDGEEEDEQRHRQKAMQQEQAEPCRIEEIIGREFCRKICTDGKPTEDDKRRKLLEQIRPVPLAGTLQ